MTTNDPTTEELEKRWREAAEELARATEEKDVTFEAQKQAGQVYQRAQEKAARADLTYWQALAREALMEVACRKAKRQADTVRDAVKP